MRRYASQKRSPNTNPANASAKIQNNTIKIQLPPTHPDPIIPAKPHPSTTPIPPWFFIAQDMKETA
ncbi:hypothetical protein HYS47_00555 [Candidatus Woesearchaeota archaeon]|nr:hypothetical protein [Candidatus Woesearchaeota archaeon]